LPSSYQGGILEQELLNKEFHLMNDPMKEGAVCGIRGCSIPSTSAPARKTHVETRPVHDLTIVSDVICPWCFVAKRNLDKALELAGNDVAVEITWRPFELNPNMPEQGMNRREYRSKKFGSWEHSQSLDAQVSAAGKLAGIAFRHDLMERTPNTFQAHRLIWLAGQEGAQDSIVEALFRAYFVEGRDVGNKAELAAIAKQAGVAEKIVSAFLESTAGTEEVRLEAESTQRGGISAVPTFILDGEELFSGAMKPEHMAARLREAAVPHVGR
jgi:predicted DsbA family dithiol-disulfide isomerase